jgi:hypothetical protein
VKKIFFVVLVVGLALFLAGCRSTGKNGDDPAPYQYTPPALGNVPQFVNDAYRNASEDVLIGVGTYRIGDDMSKMNTGMTFAQTRARADIARQMQTIIRDMVTDYAATSELDPAATLSFQENITQALTRSDLRGARIVTSNTLNGLLWVVMEYSKSAAAQDYSAAQAAARLAVPAATAFDALTRMDNAFDKAAGGGPIPVED